MRLITENKVFVSKTDIKLFNLQFPCSELRATRAYWFEFDSSGNLIDHDVPEQCDGFACAALSEDCREFFLFDLIPRSEEHTSELQSH